MNKLYQNYYIHEQHHVWHQVLKLLHIMNFFRFAISSIFYTNNTILAIKGIDNFGLP